jgi:PAS domain-containing protein
MGQRMTESYAEVWDVVGPLFGRVMAGEAVGVDDLLLLLERDGYREEAYFTLSYSPISDDAGAVGGVLGVVHETTERVLAERRLGTLRDLAGSTARATTLDEACRLGGEALAKNGADAPFALFYLLDEPGRARLSWQVGLDARPDVAAPTVDVAADRLGGWPLASPSAGGSTVVGDVAARFGPLVAGPFAEPVREAVVLRLDRAGFGPFGFLVIGVNPRRALDDAYRTFFELLCEHVVAALTNGQARREAEQARVRLYSQFMQAPVAVSVVFGDDFVYDLANPLYERMVGRQGLVGRSMHEVFPELPARRAGVRHAARDLSQWPAVPGRRVRRRHRHRRRPRREPRLQVHLPAAARRRRPPLRHHDRRPRRHGAGAGAARSIGGAQPAGGAAGPRARGARRSGGRQPLEGRVPGHARPRAAQPAGADPDRAQADAAAPSRRRRARARHHRAAGRSRAPARRGSARRVAHSPRAHHAQARARRAVRGGGQGDRDVEPARRVQAAHAGARHRAQRAAGRRRSDAAGAGGLQPRRQRRQVHRAGRAHRAVGGAHERQWRRPHRALRARQRHRAVAGSAAAAVRVLRARAAGDRPRAGRPRPGPQHRAQPGGAARRRGLRAQRWPGPRRRVRRAAAERRSAAAGADAAARPAAHRGRLR